MKIIHRSSAIEEEAAEGFNFSLFRCQSHLRSRFAVCRLSRRQVRPSARCDFEKRSPAFFLSAVKSELILRGYDRGWQERVEGGLYMFSMESAATRVQAHANTPNTMSRLGALGGYYLPNGTCASPNRLVNARKTAPCCCRAAPCSRPAFCAVFFNSSEKLLQSGPKKRHQPLTGTR